MIKKYSGFEAKIPSGGGEKLPVGGYICKILNPEVAEYSWGNVLVLNIDVDQGEYKGFYQKQFDSNTNEDKKWPYDAVYYLNVPQDDSKEYVWTNWNTFFADLEDSNKGFIFDGDVKKLKGKLIGGKFHIKQTEYNGNVYDRTKLKWTCVAEDVRKGKAGKMPQDKLIGQGQRSPAPAAASSSELDGFVNLPAGGDEDLPF